VLDLNDFSRQHLGYEAAMFAKARDKILSGAAPGFESNVLIETCVLHLRNLIEFFYPKNVQPDDVIAAHYASTWDTQKPAISPALTAARIRAHKELAHLTVTRKPDGAPDKPWDFGAICAEMKPVMEAFVGLADPSKLHPEAVAQLQLVCNVPALLLMSGHTVCGSSDPR
jgi:hypothetical protein